MLSGCVCYRQRLAVVPGDDTAADGDVSQVSGNRAVRAVREEREQAVRYFVLGIAAGGALAFTIALAANGPAVSEDSLGWDCLRQGNVTCRIDGVLVTSIDDMPTDPYDRCVYLLGISERVGGIGYANVCDSIGENR